MDNATREAWQQTGRNPQIRRDTTCALCHEPPGKKKFTFADNEGYGTESLCWRCITTAMGLVANTEALEPGDASVAIAAEAR